MFYYSGVVIAPNLSTIAGHTSGRSSLEKIPSSASFKRSAARLRKARWNIYKKIRSNERDVGKSLGYYKNLIKKFIKRFPSKLKSKEHDIWQGKIEKTSQDVKNFLSKKSEVKSSYLVNAIVLDEPKSSTKVADVFDASSKSKKARYVQNVAKAKYVSNIAKKAQIIENVNTTKSCDACAKKNYVVNLDAVVVILFTLVNLVKNDPVITKKYKTDFPKASIRRSPRPGDPQVENLKTREQNFSDLLNSEQIFDDEINTAAQVKETEVEDTSDSTETEVEDTSDAIETETPVAQNPAWNEPTVDEAEKSSEGEASNDEVAAAATLAAFEVPKEDGELSTTSVDNDVNLHGIKVTWAVCPQLRHFPVSKCRRRCEWDVMARRAVNPFYQDVKPVEKPVEKDSDEYKQRIKKASSNFLASSCVVLNKSYPIGPDPYWNLTKAGQSKAQYEAEEPVRENEEGATQPIVPDGYNKFGFKIPK